MASDLAPIRIPSAKDIEDKKLLELFARTAAESINQLGKRLQSVPLLADPTAELNDIRSQFDKLAGQIERVDVRTQNISVGTHADPNNNLVGSVGDIYVSTDPTATSKLWVKESGAQTLTGWVAITTSSSGAFVTTNTVQTVGPGAAKTFSDLITFVKNSGAILIKPSSAPSANTKMFEVQDNAGNTLGFVDSEGDTKWLSLLLNGNVADTLLVKPGSAPAANTKLLAVKTSGGTYLFSVDAEGDVVANSFGATGNVAGTIAIAPASAPAAGTALLRITVSGIDKFTVDEQGIVSTPYILVASTEIQTADVRASNVVKASNGVSTDGGTTWDYSGNGTPEGVITAPVGSTYRRKNGGAGTSFYVKESGVGNTGWVGK